MKMCGKAEGHSFHNFPHNWPPTASPLRESHAESWHPTQHRKHLPQLGPREVLPLL